MKPKQTTNDNVKTPVKRCLGHSCTCKTMTQLYVLAQACDVLGCLTVPVEVGVSRGVTNQGPGCPVQVEFWPAEDASLSGAAEAYLIPACTAEMASKATLPFQLFSDKGCLWLEEGGCRHRFNLKGVNWFGCGEAAQFVCHL